MPTTNATKAILDICLPPGKTTETEAALTVANLVGDAGGTAFLVGGCVRDAFRGHASKDLDIEVYGLSPEDLLALLSSRFNLNTVGMSFGVIKLSGYDIDVALPRLESKATPGHRGFLINTLPDLSYREACARRDFTVNAILLNLLTGEIIDPWNGQRDLEAGILRHVSDHFSEDPLRVLRAMQFAARFEFAIAPETVAICRTMTPETLPRERLASEWEKLLLKGKKPSLGLAFLRDCGWIRYYPELENLIGCLQYVKWHPEGDVWAHTLHAVDALPQIRTGHHDDDLLVAVSVLCHDFGKPKTTVHEDGGRITSHRHEVVCAPEVRAFVMRLWNSQDFLEQVLRLVNGHMRPALLVLQNASDKAYRRLSVDVERMDLLAAVVECDMRATPPNPPTLDILETFKNKADELAIAKTPPQPLLLGRHLIERGMKPGPQFGKILATCYEYQIEGKFADESSALIFLDALLRKRSKTDCD